MEHLVETAILLATNAHRGQTDKAGQPYIFHPLRVMLAVPPYEWLQAEAVLHDVVEDTDVTLEQLRDWGFPERVVQGVDALSRRPGESYDDLIARVKGNLDAVLVKPEDILDNMRPERLALLDDATVARLVAKYNPALDALK